eukprot:SAG31_NODE_3090_length_4687_cov_4.344377_4_plen_190_part_00
MVWWMMASERLRFVGAAIVELESSAPELVAEMVEQCKPLGLMLSADGTQAISVRSGNIIWDPASQRTGLTHMASDVTQAFESAAAALIVAADIAIFSSKPLCRPLPAVILDFIAANPTSSLARHFRLFMRQSWVYGMQRVTELMETHASVVEVRSYFLVFVPTIREIRDFYREMQRTNRESINHVGAAS